MGDFNLNLLNEQLHQLTSEFLDIMYANMLFPTITLPTRITWHSATLIDNIFTNDLNNYAFSGLLLSDISDHLPIFSIFNKKFEGKDEASYFLYRDKSSKNVTEFRNCLSQINWFDHDDISDPVKAYSSFFNEFSKTYINCFPLKKIKSGRSKISKPWLSKGLLNSIKKKNRLYKRYLSSPNIAMETKYKR